MSRAGAAGAHRAEPIGLTAALLIGALAQAGCDGGGRVDLAQPVPPLRAVERPLQVVLHEVVEKAPGAAVRVCRSLADRPVDLETREPTPLRQLLGDLARQVGAGFAPDAAAPGGEPLPTLRCPDGYLVIGRPPV